MMNHYFITVHDWADENDTWLDIIEYVEEFGIENIQAYLDMETAYIKTMMEFTNYFILGEYSDSLLSKTYSDEDDINWNFPDYLLLGLSWGLEELNAIKQKHFSYLTDKEKEFLLRCECRGFCSTSYYDRNTFSSLTPGSDLLYCVLELDSTIDIHDIFTARKGVFIYHDMDRSIDDPKYEVPLNCGQKVEGLCK